MYTILLFAAGLIASALAHPSQKPSQKRDYQMVHLTFVGGPASYSMAIPADGNVYTTNSSLSVSIIGDPDFDASTQCTFQTPGNVTLLQNVNMKTGDQYIVVGPPQPIVSVSCHGTCISTYGDCYGVDGQFIGLCCAGYCAADKCRPWNDVGGGTGGDE